MKKINLLLAVVILFSTNINAVFAQQDLPLEGSLTGAFSSWGKSSLQGDWQIVTVEGKSYIELNDNFRAKDGPDVKIFLSPLAASEVNGKNATDGSVFVTLIDSFEGKNRIEIPAGTNINEYKTLVFHCEGYSKLWGTSPLN